jgi:elongation factor G
VATRADAPALKAALSGLAARDDRFRGLPPAGRGGVRLGAADEAGLEAMVETLQRACAAPVRISGRGVAYCERITRRTQICHTHSCRSGEAGLEADVTLLFEPLRETIGWVFETRALAEGLPEGLADAVARGIEAARMEGLAWGVPVVGFKATLLDARRNGEAVSLPAFERAAYAAFGALKGAAGLQLLEPLMILTLHAPASSRRVVLDDLDRRLGLVDRLDEIGGRDVIHAVAPLARLSGYAEVFASLTGGCGQVEISFCGYTPLRREAPPSTDGDDDPRRAMIMRAFA